ncbi:cytochrome oxidase subunit I [Acetobacter orientalis]|uniref:Cytochrome oxidase subunit I, partial n=1 Tax=Acetobacter orientalis TaxID=146474 RepID=A0A2Z5ZIG5_9PROT|nr:cytochrome oxidase subunit I [Acetobacter orientalis]
MRLFKLFYFYITFFSSHKLKHTNETKIHISQTLTFLHFYPTEKHKCKKSGLFNNYYFLIIQNQFY